MAEPHPTPVVKHHWFRFSLRGLLVVVTLLGCWLGWELRVVQKRKAMRSWGVETQRMICVRHATPGPSVPGYNPLGVNDPVVPTRAVPVIPFWRWWLGDEAVETLLLSPLCTESDLERAKRLFPEASVQTAKWLMPPAGSRSGTVRSGYPKPKRFDGFKL